MEIKNGPGQTAICGTEFDLSRASQHRNHSGSNDIQIVTLDPELINAVWNLQGQRSFIRLHQVNRGKPSLVSFGVEVRSDSTRYFTPNPIISLLHKCSYSHFFLARRDKFCTLRSALAGGPQEVEQQTIPSTI